MDLDTQSLVDCYLLMQSATIIESVFVCGNHIDKKLSSTSDTSMSVSIANAPNPPLVDIQCDGSLNLADLQSNVIVASIKEFKCF